MYVNNNEDKFDFILFHIKKLRKKKNILSENDFNCK